MCFPLYEICGAVKFIEVEWGYQELGSEVREMGTCCLKGTVLVLQDKMVLEIACPTVRMYLIILRCKLKMVKMVSFVIYCYSLGLDSLQSLMWTFSEVAGSRACGAGIDSCCYTTLGSVALGCHVTCSK